MYDILGVFGMQIEFLRIFDKFLKIPLMEVVAIGWLTVATATDDGQQLRMVAGGDRY